MTLKPSMLLLFQKPKQVRKGNRCYYKRVDDVLWCPPPGYQVAKRDDVCMYTVALAPTMRTV